jgi:hypothetical protein
MAGHGRQGRITHAEEDLVRGLELARRGDARFEQVYGLAVHAWLEDRLGDHHGATELLIEAMEVLAAASTPASCRDVSPEPTRTDESH